MFVLNTSSPKTFRRAPKNTPRMVVPSSRTRLPSIRWTLPRFPVRLLGFVSLVPGPNDYVTRGDFRVVTKDRVPDSIKHPLSMKADYADPYLYGGASVIVGVVGLIGSGVVLIVGNRTAAGVLLALSVVLIVAGYLVARRGS